MADIIVSNIKKSFTQDRVILNDISFQINEGEKAALLGANGSGKTTLLKIITGELSPDAGSVAVPKAKKVGYVAQLNAFEGDCTVLEALETAYDDVRAISRELDELSKVMDESKADRYAALTARYESMGGYEWESELRRVASGLGIGDSMLSMPVNSLSGGEKTRVALARLIMMKSDILLLDEPTNHLDIASLEWLENYLRAFKGTVLVVSHDRYFLDSVVDRVIEIERGKADFYTGNYSYYAREKEVRYQRQLMQYNREQAKKKQLEFQITRLKAWSNVYDNPALAKRAKVMEGRLERTLKTEKPVKEAKLDMGFSSAAFRADIALEIEDVSKAFGDKKLFENVTAGIYGQGRRVAILGPNGSGKTTLLKILLGEEQPDSGSVRFGRQILTAYLPQVVEFSDPERTLYDTMLYETGCEPQEARDRLGAYRFSGEDQFKKVSELSGGERARLRLCIVMREKVNMLILDEPTNHLDLNSREWIEEAVAGFSGTLIFVSHDRYFINRFADRIWEIDGGVFTDYDCGYERYRSIKAKAAIAAASVKAPRREKERAPVEKREKKERNSARDARKQAVLEREIASLEEEIASYGLRMEIAASDYIALGKLEEEKRALNEKLEEMYARWAEYEENE